MLQGMSIVCEFHNGERRRFGRKDVPHVLDEVLQMLRGVAVLVCLRKARAIGIQLVAVEEETSWVARDLNVSCVDVVVAIFRHNVFDRSLHMGRSDGQRSPCGIVRAVPKCRYYKSTFIVGVPLRLVSLPSRKKDRVACGVVETVETLCFTVDAGAV